MRGAHTCGALMALAEKGDANFDVVAAASAGACTAAYLVSRQFHLFPVIWTKYLHDGRFFDLKRLPTRRSVMDLDFLVHRVFREIETLDLNAIRASATKFYIVSTDCGTGEPKYFDAHTDPILNALKASAAMPIAYRHPVVVEGRTYIDGGVTDPIPVRKAIEAGCEDITVLLTRPEGYRKKIPFVNVLPRLYARRYPRLAEAFLRRFEAYNRTVEAIESGKLPARLTVIRPRAKLPVTRLTTSLPKIEAAIRQGFEDALQALGSKSLN
jgi:predicted patatin/cPLA2 family phospholipase